MSMSQCERMLDGSSLRPEVGETEEENVCDYKCPDLCKIWLCMFILKHFLRKNLLMSNRLKLHKLKKKKKFMSMSFRKHLPSLLQLFEYYEDYVSRTNFSNIPLILSLYIFFVLLNFFIF